MMHKGWTGGGGDSRGGEKLNGVRTGVNNCRQVLFRDTLLKHGDSVLGSTAYFPKVASALALLHRFLIGVAVATLCGPIKTSAFGL